MGEYARTQWVLSISIFVPIDVEDGDGDSGGAAGGSQAPTGDQLSQHYRPSPSTRSFGRTHLHRRRRQLRRFLQRGRCRYKANARGRFFPTLPSLNAAKLFDDTTSLATNAVRWEAGPGLVPVNRWEKNDTVPSKSITDVSSIAAAHAHDRAPEPSRQAHGAPGGGTQEAAPAAASVHVCSPASRTHRCRCGGGEGQ